MTKSCSYCLYAYDFRIYFTPFIRVLFAFPSRYWFTIGRSRVFSLGGWSPHIQTGFHVSRPTCSMLSSTINLFRVRDYHPLSSSFPTCSTIITAKSYQALPNSLATTKGISVDFFSSGYLDVSVPLVRLYTLYRVSD